MMLVLTSMWTLKRGCPAELAQALRELPETVRRNEPDTLCYRVLLPAPVPVPVTTQRGAGSLPMEPDAPAIPLAEMNTVTFFEVYASAQAFSAHLSGEAFTEFLQTWGPLFEEDPARPGWPRTQNASLTPLAGFTRVPGD